MPALEMFGRRWALAADDVPVLALPAAIFHALWFIFLVVGFSAIQKPDSCANTSSYETCIIGLFICFFLSTVLESWLVREGIKGFARHASLNSTSILAKDLICVLSNLQAAYLRLRSGSVLFRSYMLKWQCS